MLKCGDKSFSNCTNAAFNGFNLRPYTEGACSSKRHLSSLPHNRFQGFLHTTAVHISTGKFMIVWSVDVKLLPSRAIHTFLFRVQLNFQPLVAVYPRTH